jgi:hypothetical protein
MRTDLTRDSLPHLLQATRTERPTRSLSCVAALLLTVAAFGGGADAVPQHANGPAETGIRYIQYGAEKFAWFVPSERLLEFLESNPPQGTFEGLRSLLQRSCDFQGLGPQDSTLCFRAPKSFESEDERWERSRRSLEEQGMSPDRQRFLDHVERRSEARRVEAGIRGVRVNPCDGQGAEPLALPSAAPNPIEQVEISELTLIGKVTNTRSGWNPTGGLLVTEVTVRVESIVERPPGIEIQEEVRFLESRASFEVERLRICSGPEARANSEIGAEVLITSANWSSNGDLLTSAVVYELADGLIIRDLVLGGAVSGEVPLEQFITAASTTR